MPTYEYKCPKCGTQFETIRKMTSKAVARCPKCGAVAERQLSTGTGLVFKGSGFYITDYKRAGEKREKDTGGAPEKPAKAEAKPASEPAKPRKKKDE